MRRRRAKAEILALDIGTSSVRCGLFDAQARPIRGQRRSATYRLHEAFHAAELDPFLLLRATKKCLHGLTNRSSLTIGGCGFMHSLLGLDARGNPLTPIYTWADSRAVEDARRLREKFDERAILARTGCMLRASFWPAKLIWLCRIEPKIFRHVARWVSPAEWIFEKLFDVRACSIRWRAAPDSTISTAKTGTRNCSSFAA